MKSLIVILSLAISVNVFANSVAQTSMSPLFSSAATSLGYAEKQAALILDDVQAYMQTGEASTFLSQKILEAQEINDGASEADAVEMLVNEAQTILSK